MLDPVRQEVADNLAHRRREGGHARADARGRHARPRPRHRHRRAARVADRGRAAGRARVAAGRSGRASGGSGLRRRPTDLAHLAGRRRRRAEPADRGVQPGAGAARPPCRPNPAHGRRPQRPHAVSQRPQHAAGAVPVRGDSDHQRERHGARRRAASETSATTTGWPRWSPTCCGRRCWCCSPTSKACTTAIPAGPSRSVIPIVDESRRSDPRVSSGRRPVDDRPESSEQGRHGQQAGGGAAGHARPAKT